MCVSKPRWGDDGNGSRFRRRVRPGAGETNEKTRASHSRCGTRQLRPCGGFADDEAARQAEAELLGERLGLAQRVRGDCPISAYGITLYGTLDVNATYLNEGVEYSPSADKVNYTIQRNAYESKWLAGYNGLSASVIGLKMKEDLARSVSGLVADRRPRSGRQSVLGHVRQRPAHARRQQRPARRHMLPFRTTNFDGSRAGQWDNSQGYLGSQQSRLRHADLRPHQLARPRRHVGLRPGRVDAPSRRSAFRPRSPALAPARRSARTPPSPIA